MRASADMSVSDMKAPRLRPFIFCVPSYKTGSMPRQADLVMEAVSTDCHEDFRLAHTLRWLLDGLTKPSAEPVAVDLTASSSEPMAVD